MEQAQVIGAGLAGCEAALQLANSGVPVTLFEMKPAQFSPAHSYEGFAELVCSNSLKALRVNSAAGLLKEEMKRFDSVVVSCALETAVPAGGALAVDRERFSDAVTKRVAEHPLICVVREEITRIPEGYVVIATGPLTSSALADAIAEKLGSAYLSFYDAAAPIVAAESIDESRTFLAARYGRGDDDYINCPMNKEEYDAFYDALVAAQSAPLKAFDRQDLRVYEGCMPVEVMAKRGRDTLRFGPLRPVGLRDPRTGRRPWANVQLRRENAQGTLYNLVGFQTNLKFGEQKRVFSMIPGLENAEFMRYGVMHRNTFIDSPRLLDQHFRLKSDGRIFFAGQLTGVEGYVESAMSGIIAGNSLARILNGKKPYLLPADCMIGALCAYISDESVKDFQPMGCNMGILPPAGVRVKDKGARYQLVADRALASLDAALARQKDR